MTVGRQPEKCKTVAGTEVFCEERTGADLLAEERKKMIDSVLEKVLRKQLQSCPYSTRGREKLQRPRSTERQKGRREREPDAVHSEPVKVVSLW